MLRRMILLSEVDVKVNSPQCGLAFRTLYNCRCGPSLSCLCEELSTKQSHGSITLDICSFRANNIVGMDSTMNKIYCPEIRFNTIENLQTYKPIYRKDMDVFYLRSEPNRPATAYDLSGLIWLRIDIETGDIAGIQIYNLFEVVSKLIECCTLAMGPWHAGYYPDIERRIKIEFNAGRKSLYFIFLLSQDNWHSLSQVNDIL